MSLVSILLRLFCQLIRRTSERVLGTGVWRLWTFSNMVWFCLITKVLLQSGPRGSTGQSTDLEWVSEGLYKEHRTSLSLDLQSRLCGGTCIGQSPPEPLCAESQWLYLLSSDVGLWQLLEVPVSWIEFGDRGHQSLVQLCLSCMSGRVGITVNF